MVAELGQDAPVVAWCAQTTPCTSVFLPLAVGVELPPALTFGSGEPDRRSAWWRMKALGDAVMDDPAERTPVVQAVWHAWERELLEGVAADRAAAGRAVGQRVERMLHRCGALLAQLATARPVAHGG
jgi:dipeptidase